MFGNTVLREDVNDEELSEFGRSDSNVTRDEDALLRHAVNNNKDSIKAIGVRELFNEVHRDGVPRLLGDRELVEIAVGLVVLRFGSHAVCTGLAVVFDKGPKSRPSVLTTNEFDGLVLSKVTSKDVIVLVL